MTKVKTSTLRNKKLSSAIG